MACCWASGVATFMGAQFGVIECQNLGMRNLANIHGRKNHQKSAVISCFTLVSMLAVLTVATVGSAWAASTVTTKKAADKKAADKKAADSKAAKREKVSAKEANSIEEYLGFATSDQQRLQRIIEEQIQKCMKHEGFSYTPSGGNDQLPRTADGQLDQKAFAAKWGYGISTFLDPNDPAKSRLGEDKNAKTLAKMSAAERTAYQRALVGKSGANNPAALLGGDGCVSKAVTAAIGDLSALLPLQNKYQKEVETRINADAKVVEGMKKWSSCMKEQGFAFAKDSEVAGKFTKRFQVLLSTVGVADSGFGGGFGVDNSAKLSKVDKVALSKLQKDEVATAVSDVNCATKYLKVRNEVKKKLDQAFIVSNEATLSSARDKINP